MAVQRLLMVRRLTDEFHQEFPAVAGKLIPNTPTFPYVLVTLCMLGWALSIVFVIQQRSGNKTDGTFHEV